MRMLVAVILVCILSVSCRVGKGEGYLHGCLYYPACDEDDFGRPVEGCTEDNENYFLDPGFFAAQKLDNGSLLITIQKDGYWIGESDGLNLLIPEYKKVSEELDEAEFVDKIVPPRSEHGDLPQSERYEASYYFLESCSGNYASFTGGTGTLRLYSLYRPNSESEEINGEFDLYFEDTRPVEEGETAPHLVLTGYFKFEYERGVPAQHFP